MDLLNRINKLEEFMVKTNFNKCLDKLKTFDKTNLKKVETIEKPNVQIIIPKESNVIEIDVLFFLLLFFLLLIFVVLCIYFIDFDHFYISFIIIQIIMITESFDSGSGFDFDFFWF